ncbi:tetratricopeptide repeat protein,von Willebrand factor type A-like protein [Beggiatoa alba B18LD]|uniref:Tetratricopeptide repeat protein,von Willebrand factor type A-like protein n=1 Tax=Beggiatoa alba B18LD TaxID=395493 RepID=I3CHY3_9GAMM|nr:VWA domain-containing protein [Beggiatoa alba]EIJ43226.1 tetratricopeptide repeat protein,von Willebrand factor type A-like protein [Beggiatoa alba B18LD]
MMNWTDFHFLRPYALLTFLPFIILLYFWFKRRQQSGQWASVCDPQLLPYLILPETRSANTHYTTLLIVLTGSLAIFALAGPTMERLPQPVFREQSALIITLDLSRSMLATDVKPSRLERARYKIADIVNRRQTGQTALLVFAGSAFVVTPLTDDKETILSQLSALTPNIMPIQGGRTDLALTKAVELLQQASVKTGQVLLITDEAESNHTLNEIQKLTNLGYQLSIFGVGTPEGAPIPITKEGFLKDNQGNIVIPTLDEAHLMQLTTQGNGIYQRLAIDDSDTNALFALIDQGLHQKSNATTQEAQLHVERWYELGTYLLLLALPFSAFAFRRGYFVIIPLTIGILSLHLSPPVYAEEAQAKSSIWQNLWATPDQQASQALQTGDAKTAATLFDNPEWKAAAHYKAGEYEQALQNLETLNTPTSLYNKGNTLTKLGKYEEAHNAYEQALAQDPSLEDARYNKEQVKKFLEEQKKQAEQNKQDKNQASDKQDKNNDKKDPDNSSQGQQNAEQQGNKEGDNAQNSPKDAGQQNQSQAENGEKKQDEPSNDSESQQSATDGQNTQSDKQANASEQKTLADKEKEQQAKAQQQASATDAQSEEKPETDKTANAVSSETTKPMSEEQTAQEQWLRRIPDDPSGLLRRKFRYQYSQQQNFDMGTGKEW